MIYDNDVAYYRKREADARRRAFDSDDGGIKRIHHELADRYAAKVCEMTSRPVRTIG